MKSKLLNFLLALTLAVSTSCTTTYSGPRDKKVEKSDVLGFDIVSVTDISITNASSLSSSNVEILIETTDDYLEYIEFRKKYSAGVEEIIDHYSNERLDRGNKTFMALVDELKKDPNKHAQNYLGRVKNFEYVKRVYYDAEVGAVWKKEYDYSLEKMALDVVMLPYQLYFYLKEDKSASSGIRKKPTREKFYDDFRVHPYYGTEIIINKEVKVE
ncbi:MAG: hypothetical protein ABIH72_02545 [archaeon]